jgi:hypothetical protein
MKTLNAKLILSAFGIVALLSSPAFAQKPTHQVSHEQTQVQAPVEQYPDEGVRSGSASNTFEQDHGFYTAN